MNGHNEVTLVDVGDPVKAVAQTCAEKCPMCNSVSEWRRHVAMAEAVFATLERFKPKSIDALAAHGLSPPTVGTPMDSSGRIG